MWNRSAWGYLKPNEFKLYFMVIMLVIAYGADQITNCIARDLLLEKVSNLAALTNDLSHKAADAILSDPKGVTWALIARFAYVAVYLVCAYFLSCVAEHLARTFLVDTSSSRYVTMNRGRLFAPMIMIIVLVMFYMRHIGPLVCSPT